MRGRRRHHSRRPGARGGAGGEHERELAAGVVPHRHRGVGNDHGRVGRHRGGERGRNHAGDPTDTAQLARQRREGRDTRRGPEGGEEPRPDVHG